MADDERLTWADLRTVDGWRRNTRFVAGSNEGGSFSHNEVRPLLHTCAQLGAWPMGGTALLAWRRHYRLPTQPVRDLDLVARPHVARAIADALGGTLGTRHAYDLERLRLWHAGAQVLLRRKLPWPLLPTWQCGFAYRFARIDVPLNGAVLEIDVHFSSTLHPAAMPRLSIDVDGMMISVPTPLAMMEDLCTVLEWNLGQRHVHSGFGRERARAGLAKFSSRLLEWQVVLDHVLADPELGPMQQQHASSLQARASDVVARSRTAR